MLNSIPFGFEVGHGYQGPFVDSITGIPYYKLLFEGKFYKVSFMRLWQKPQFFGGQSE